MNSPIPTVKSLTHDKQITDSAENLLLEITTNPTKENRITNVERNNLEVAKLITPEETTTELYEFAQDLQSKIKSTVHTSEIDYLTIEFTDTGINAKIYFQTSDLLINALHTHMSIYYQKIPREDFQSSKVRFFWSEYYPDRIRSLVIDSSQKDQLYDFSSVLTLSTTINKLIDNYTAGSTLFQTITKYQYTYTPEETTFYINTHAEYPVFPTISIQ